MLVASVLTSISHWEQRSNLLCYYQLFNNAGICCIVVSSCKPLLLSKDFPVSIVSPFVDLLLSWNMLVLSPSTNQTLV